MKTTVVSTPTRSARVYSQALDDMYGRSVLYELTVDERLVNYFMSKCKSVD